MLMLYLRLYLPLHRQNLLVVEDIIDTGLTMVKLLEVLKQHQPKSIRVASLFWKRNPKSCGYMPECKSCSFFSFSFFATCKSYFFR